MRSLPRLLSLIILFQAVISSSKADSPLTSTYFCESYMGQKLVKYAADKRTVDKKIAKYLLSDKNPIEIKAAIANALGWDIDGKGNAALLLGFLEKKYGKEISDPLNNPMTAHEQIIYGYLMGLDNYFEPANALPWVEAAAKKAPTSFTVQMLAALVRSQVYFDSDWCQVWKVVNEVNINKSLTRELNEDAIGIIMEYINLYKEDCK